MAPVQVDLVTTPAQRAQAFAIRGAVFQDEQHVPAAEEFDADDDVATHVLAHAAGIPVGTGRLVVRDRVARIGRMAVLPSWRRRGVGRALMQELLRLAVNAGATRIVLHAQVHAIPFYTAVGFHVVSDEFMEAGIPHRRMERAVGRG